MDVVELRNQFDDSWTSLVKVKNKYYATISHYYKALASGDEGKYGHVISYLTLAENYAKEANKLAKSFANNYPSFSVSSSDVQSASSGKSTSASQALLEATKAYLALVTEKKKQAIKDNDIIYQEIVPNADTLEAPEKLCVVKNLNFVDICPNGQKEAQGIIGQDIFHRLIPISVHEASSLYSEEKAKILRAEMERCDNADTDFQILLETQDIINTVNKSKDALKNEGVNESMISFPKEISTFCDLVQKESEAGKSISSTIASLNSLQMKAHDNLNNIGLELDKEQREYDLKLQIYNMKWTQEPSVSASTNIRQNLKKYRSSLEEAINADNLLITKYNNNKQNIEALEQPIDKIKSDYISSILSSNSKTEKSVNLIDVNIDDIQDNKQKEKEKIERIEALIMNLRGCQGERRKLIDELKYKIQNDDISNILLIKKNKEKQVFQNELGKFQGLRDNISRNINDHTNFLRALTEEFNELKSESEAYKSINTINEKKEQKDKEYKEAYELWKEIYKNLESGIRLYTNLNEMIDNLTIETNKYVSQRLTQRNELEKKIKEAKAADDQKILLSKLNSLNLSSTNTPTSATPSTPNVPPINMQSPVTNYFASQQNTVASPQAYSYNTNIASTSISTTVNQSPSVALNKPLSLVTSPTQTSSQFNNYSTQPTQSSQQPLSTPSYQQPKTSSISQQASLATPVTQYNYQQTQPQTPANQPQASTYPSYQQSQLQIQSSTYSSYQEPQQLAQVQSQQPQHQPKQSQSIYQPQPPSALNMQNQTALKLQQVLSSPQVQTSTQPQQPSAYPQQSIQTPTAYQTQQQSVQTPTKYQAQQQSIQTPTSYQTQQQLTQPQGSLTQTNYQYPVSAVSSYPQSSTAVPSATVYQTPTTYQSQLQQPQQPIYTQTTSTTPAYLSTTYGTSSQQQIQPASSTYGNMPTVTTTTTQNYTYQQNTYNNMYKPQSTQPTTLSTVPVLPPKPTAAQDPLSSQMISPVRPPLPPPPGSVSFGQTNVSKNIYGQPQQPPQQPQLHQQPSTTYTNYYGQATTSSSTSNYTNQYALQPQQQPQPQRPIAQIPTQQSYYNAQQQPQQPVYTATNTTVYGYQPQPQPQPLQPQQPLTQNPYYRPPVQPQQPQQNYYQTPQQSSSAAIAQVNSIQNQQLASLSQYKPLKPQQYNQPSLLD
jgi:hypothetical protein